jgi:stage II sporulation protein D
VTTRRASDPVRAARIPPLRAAAVMAAAALGAAGCARVPAPSALREAPLVRVGIVVDRPSGTFSATSQFRVLSAAGDILAVVDRGAVWRAEPAGPGTVRLVRPDRDAPLVTASPVAVEAEDPGAFVVIAGQPFRGAALVQRGSTGVTIVNRVPLEWYVQSVTAVELGFRAPEDRQAVMAQSVAARTYAVRYLGRREALGFDLYATDADQAYPGVAGEKPEVTDATRRTFGQVLTYGGRPIEALFHSTCGHSTEAASEVFRSEADVPYLRAVSDRYGRGPTDYYCSISPRFRWREEWDDSALTAILARTLPTVTSAAATMGQVTDVRVTRTTPTGRVRELVVETTNGTFTVPGYRVRDVLRAPPDRQLWSSQFQLHEERNGTGLVRLVAAGAGAGHGVGMCQWGAVGRSRAGQRYDRILATYYPGTQLQRMF